MESTIFDVRIFNPNVQSNLATPVISLYRQHEQQKRRRYEERVIEVEQASFTPLFFSVTGGCSRLTSVFLQRLAELMSAKRAQPYSVIMAWLRCRVSFCLLRAAIMYVRAGRSRVGHHKRSREVVPDLACAEAVIDQ